MKLSHPTPASDLLPDGTKPGCAFCDVRAEKGFAVVRETPEFVVFRDRSPGSKVHLLAVPRRHVDNVKTLTGEDVGMVQRMKELGREVLLAEGVAEGEQRLGFHIPPFFSVNHLHLHLLSLPLPFPGSLKYRSSLVPSPSLPSQTARLKLKGFSWFVEAQQVTAILGAGARVKGDKLIAHGFTAAIDAKKLSYTSALRRVALSAIDSWSFSILSVETPSSKAAQSSGEPAPTVHTTTGGWREVDNPSRRFRRRPLTGGRNGAVVFDEL